MMSSRWLQKRKPFWDRLEKILGRAGRRGLVALSAHELQEVSLLYRQVASDLATVREDPLSQRLAEYLNQLWGRAHNLIYMGRAPRPRGVIRFYHSVFPQVFRETFNYTLAAFGLFLLGALVGFLATLSDPAFQRFFLGEKMARSIDRRVMWTQSIVTIKPLASSGIMTNNLSVSFSAFATGMLGGVGTVYILLMNGLLLGVISAACWQAGMAKDLFSFVAPHGVIEIPSILIAGAAGLLLARGLLFPGSMTRRDALVCYGGRAIRLVAGIIPLLVVAGILEGFVSPSPLTATIKWATAALSALLLCLYLGAAGRRRERQVGRQAGGQWAGEQWADRQVGGQMRGRR